MGLAINAAIVILAELGICRCQTRRYGNHSLNRQQLWPPYQLDNHHPQWAGLSRLSLLAADFGLPFAIAIAGGTLLTTLLSLVWVPTMYLLLMKPVKANNQSAIPA